MKNSKKKHNIAGQSNDNVRKSQKHDANLRKNSILYFQIGLILCLLASYGVLELKFEKATFPAEYAVIELPDDDMVDVLNVVPEEVFVKRKKTVSAERNVNDPDPEIIEDEDPMIDENEFFADSIAIPEFVDPRKMGTIENPVKNEIIEIFDMKDVEIVPIYPGCEKMTTNKTRIRCMSEKLTRLIQRKFDTDLAYQLGLTGTQRINVQFKIDKQGHVTDVLTRAPHPELEKEAERLTTKIPTMKPGLQRHKPVSVLYNLPIVFKVQN